MTRTANQLTQIPKFVKAGSDATRGKKLERLANENNPAWKGDTVSYSGIHRWIKRHFGKPSRCEHCSGKNNSKRYEWANISGEYQRDRSDWFELCATCHKHFDYGKWVE